MDFASVFLALTVAVTFEPGPETPSEPTITSQQPDTGVVVPESRWPNILDAAREALQQVRTAQGAFIQSNADGSVLTGRFALERPGKIRFDYDDPSPVLIVSDGVTVAMQDRALETVDRVPLQSTPFGLVLDRNFDTTGKNVDVLGISRYNNRIGINLQDAEGEIDGSVTLVFTYPGYDLLGWEAIDGQTRNTRVNLVNTKTNMRLDPRLFRLDEDEDDPR